MCYMCSHDACPTLHKGPSVSLSDCARVCVCVCVWMSFVKSSPHAPALNGSIAIKSEANSKELRLCAHCAAELVCRSFMSVFICMCALMRDQRQSVWSLRSWFGPHWPKEGRTHFSSVSAGRSQGSVWFMPSVSCQPTPQIHSASTNPHHSPQTTTSPYGHLKSLTISNCDSVICCHTKKAIE